MTRSALANRRVSIGQNQLKRGSRQGKKVTLFQIHHAAGSGSTLLDIFAKDGGRGTSANYAILEDGTICVAVDEEYRAWTSGGKRDGATTDGARYDEMSITVEVANSGGAPNWPVSARALESLAQLIADVTTRYGIPVRRATAATGPSGILGHRDLLAQFKASFATACPFAIDVDAVIRRVQQIKEGSGQPAPAGKGKNMYRAWDTRGVGYVVTDQGAAGLPSGQVDGLFLRLINSNQAVGRPETFTAAEMTTIDSTLRLIARANQVGAVIDAEKFKSALQDALGSGIDVDATIDDEVLAKAIEEATARIARKIAA